MSSAASPPAAITPDRIRAEYAALLEAFTNLVKSARVVEEHGGRAQGGGLVEVFVEKMLQAAHSLLGVIAELQRNALLNDVRARNAEVAAAAAAHSQQRQLQPV